MVKGRKAAKMRLFKHVRALSEIENGRATVETWLNNGQILPNNGQTPLLGADGGALRGRLGQRLPAQSNYGQTMVKQWSNNGQSAPPGQNVVK